MDVTVFQSLQETCATRNMCTIAEVYDEEAERRLLAAVRRGLDYSSVTEFFVTPIRDACLLEAMEYAYNYGDLFHLFDDDAEFFRGLFARAVQDSKVTVCLGVIDYWSCFAADEEIPSLQKWIDAFPDRPEAVAHASQNMTRGYM